MRSLKDEEGRTRPDRFGRLTWEELTEGIRDGLIGEHSGRRLEAILIDDYKVLTLIRLMAGTGAIMLMEIIDPRCHLVLVRIFSESRTENLGLCVFPLLIEVGENLYFRYESGPGIERIRIFPRVSVIEILEDRSF